MSKLGTKITMAVAMPTFAAIRKGRIGPTLIGVLLGGLIGATSWLIHPYLLGFGAGLGAIVGAAVAALLFPQAQTRLGVSGADRDEQGLGEIRHYWTGEGYGCPCLTVLTEHALYIAASEKAPWGDVLNKLERGDDPEIGSLIRLEELQCIELARWDTTELVLVRCRDGRVARRYAHLADDSEREDFLAALQRETGRTFRRSEETMPLGRATRVPLVLLIVIAVAVAGLMWLSWYWITNPPPPPYGKREQDELVRLFSWLGPSGVAFYGIAPFLVVWSWLMFRYVRPPKLCVLRLTSPKAEKTR